MAEESIESSNVGKEPDISYLRDASCMRVWDPKTVTFPVLDHLLRVDFACMLESHGGYASVYVIGLGCTVWKAVEDCKRQAPLKCVSSEAGTSGGRLVNSCSAGIAAL